MNEKILDIYFEFKKLDELNCEEEKFGKIISGLGEILKIRLKNNPNEIAIYENFKKSVFVPITEYYKIEKDKIKKQLPQDAVNIDIRKEFIEIVDDIYKDDIKKIKKLRVKELAKKYIE